MFSLPLLNHLGLRRVTISSLVTCIYLPIIVSVVSYQGLLYSVGNASSFYILVLIFTAELLKSFYLNSENDIQTKKNKASKNRDLLKGLVFLLVVMFCFFVGIILFGAPVLDCHEQTLMLSALLTLLTVFPLIAHMGVEMSIELLFLFEVKQARDSIEEMLVNNALLTVCGAWLGAVVIPLDWNTPWQQWPIPCYLGAMGGYLLSNVLNIIKVALLTAAYNYPSLHFLKSILNKVHIKYPRT